jgi:hypothetical protein
MTVTPGEWSRWSSWEIVVAMAGESRASLVDEPGWK